MVPGKQNDRDWFRFIGTIMRGPLCEDSTERREDDRRPGAPIKVAWTGSLSLTF